MDLGIAGRKAIVCASSRGLGSACAFRLAEAGCEVVVNGLDAKRLEATAAEIAQGDRRQGHPRSRPTSAPPKARPRCSPPARSRTSWSTTMPARRSAISASSTAQKMIDGVIGNMIVPIELIQKAIDPMVEEEVRPHRQHHLGLGEDAARRARPVVRRARRPDRVPRRRGALGRAQHNVTINFLLPGPFDTDRLRSNNENTAKKQGITLRAGGGRARRDDPGQAVRQRRTSSARPARSCARRTPATSPGRTC